jgi:hypothetical protein
MQNTVALARRMGRRTRQANVAKAIDITEINEGLQSTAAYIAELSGQLAAIGKDLGKTRARVKREKVQTETLPNAHISLGLARYGHVSQASGIFAALFEAAACQEMRRLPELFFGLVRRPHRGPTAYPVACAPQSWASAAPLRCLGHALGSASAAKTMRPNFVTRFCLDSSIM